MKRRRPCQTVEGNGFLMVAEKQLPNDPCKCGSGKKAKRCCGTETTFYYTKLNEKQIAEREEKAKAEREKTLEATN
jgi:hypothetical protein